MNDDVDEQILRSMDRASRKRMKIVAHVEGSEFVIHIAHGNQNIKWLAAAAAARYSRQIVANGRLRQREVEHREKAVLLPSTLASPRPGAIESKSKEPSSKVSEKLISGENIRSPTPILQASFSPTDLIREVLNDGDHIYVSLTSGKNISRDAGAHVTSFQRAAFHTHPTHKRRVRKFALKIKSRRKPKKVSESITANAVSDLFEERHIQNTAELRKRCRQEFKRSKIRFILQRRGNEDPEPVFEVLAKYFHEIEEIYMFFSTLDDGPINSMSSKEFQQFADHCGILSGESSANFTKSDDDVARMDDDYPSELNVSEIDNIFVSCNIEKDSEGRVVHSASNPSRELLRFEFLEAIVRLAIAKYQSDSVLQDAPVRDMVERLCVQYILDYGNEICERSLYLRERLSSPAVLSVLHDHLRMLKRVFKAYCKRDLGPSSGCKDTAKAAAEFDRRRGSVRKGKGIVLTKSKSFHADDDRTISFNEFRLLMSETHCIDERINLRTMKTIYMQSMQFSYSITQTAEEVFRTTTQQVFIEFLEALARVAIAKFGESMADDESGDQSLAKNMRKLFEEHIKHMDPRMSKT